MNESLTGALRGRAAHCLCRQHHPLTTRLFTDMLEI